MCGAQMTLQHLHLLTAGETGDLALADGTVDRNRGACARARRQRDAADLGQRLLDIADQRPYFALRHPIVRELGGDDFGDKRQEIGWIRRLSHRCSARRLRGKIAAPI